MYVDSYVLSVAEENKNDYIKIANKFAEVAKDFGVLEIFENWEKEVPDGKHTDFRKAVQAKAGEKIVLSWIIWPDRETADLAHKEMFSDPRMAEIGEMPFDGKRMILGGFEPILSYRKEDV
jgi:uncharacterized protein YbaA (DUF1428 family)